MNGPFISRTFAFVLCFLLIGSVAAFSQDAKELNLQGITAMRNGNYKESMDLFRQAVKIEPSRAETYYNIHQLLKLVKKPEEARRAMQKAFEMDGNEKTFQEGWATYLKEDLRAAEARKDSAGVEKLRRQILDVNPGELEMAVAIAKEFSRKKDVIGLKTLVRTVLDKNKTILGEYNNPSIGQLYLLLARAEFESSELKMAREHADKAGAYPLDNQDEARELLSKVKQTFKEQIDGHVRLGKSFVQKGDNAAAVEEFKKAMALDPENDDLANQISKLQTQADAKNYMEDARKLVSQQKWLEARDLLDYIIQNDAKNAEAKTLLAKAVAFEEDVMKKIGRAEKLPRTLEEQTSMIESLINMGKRYLDAGNKKDAKVAFEQALAVISCNSDLEKLRDSIDAEMKKIVSAEDQKALYAKATTELYKTGDYEECLKALEQLPRDYGVDQLSYMAYCHWKLGNMDKAVEFAQLQLTKQAQNNRAKFVLGNVYHEKGDNGTAYKVLMEIKDADPEYPGIDDILLKVGTRKWGPYVIPLVIIIVLLWIAYVIYNSLPEYNKNATIRRARKFLKAGHNREAIEECLKAKKFPNRNQYDEAVISRLLAQANLKTGQYEKAVGDCKHLLSINSGDTEAHQWLGYAFLGLRRLTPESLNELLNLYKTVEGKNVALISLLGQHYAQQKILAPEGVEVLEKWLDAEPNNPEVLKTLGKFYLQKGRTDGPAMKVFEQMMLTLKPEPDFILGVAKLQLRLGNHDQCLKSCETVLGLDVNNELVHGILRECYQKMDRLPELMEIYRGFLAENPYNTAFQKGITDCKKLLEKTGHVVGSGGGEAQKPLSGASPAAPDASSPGVAGPEGEILCPHCQKPNSQADYYCQHCGKSIV